MIHYVECNVLVVDADYIVHQVNCRGVMGAGLALTLRNINPRMYEMYKKYCQEFDARDLLGKAFICDNIISIFGQLNYGRDKSVVYTNYKALERAFKAVNERLPDDKTIAFPYGFGCGLANGNWDTVQQLIAECFPNRTVYICKIK